MVCEKKKYFLFGINAATGTSFTPKSTSQWVKSVQTSMPSASYSSSVKTRMGELSTNNSACG